MKDLWGNAVDLARRYLSLPALLALLVVVGLASFELNSVKEGISGADVAVVLVSSSLASMCVVELHKRVLGARARFHQMTLKEFLPLPVPRPIAALPLERVMGHVSTQYDSIIAAGLGSPDAIGTQFRDSRLDSPHELPGDTPADDQTAAAASGDSSLRFSLGEYSTPWTFLDPISMVVFLTKGDVGRGEVGNEPSVQTVRAVVDARLDWVQTIVAGRWQQIVRTESVVVATIAAALTASSRVGGLNAALLLTALGGLVGGVLSWTLRDFAAIVERRRQ